MSRVLDLCAIDAGQTNTSHIVFDKGREILSDDTDQGITNILLSGAADSLRKNLTSVVRKTRRMFGRCRFRVVSAGYTGVSKEREEYPGSFFMRESALLLMEQIKMETVCVQVVGATYWATRDSDSGLV